MTKTASQYTVDLYNNYETDDLKFYSVFTNRLDYTSAIYEEVKVWIANNVDRWRVENLEWFKIELIPDDMLPRAVFESVGERHRKRSVAGVREIFFGGESPSRSSSSRRRSIGRSYRVVHPEEDNNNE